MTDLTAAYEELARRSTHEQLACQYREAKRRGEQLPECAEDHLILQPIAMLATAVPACAALSVAIHVVHVLPRYADPELVDRLVTNAEHSGAVALQRCHRALELDGRVHDHTTDEWLPTICDIAAPLFEGARPNHEPPSIVELAQDAVRWLSCAIVDLDQDASDSTAAILDVLARLLALHAFASVVRELAGRA